MNVKLTEAQKIHVLNSDHIAVVMQQILMRENKIRRNQEHFWVVGLNNKNKILFIELISLGASNRVNVDPPDMFRMAIYKLATSVIMVHNHPSGVADPSDADKKFTQQMFIAGKYVRIDVIDHLIISEKSYTSFVDLGIMQKLTKEARQFLSPEEQKKMAAMEKEMEHQRGVQDAQIEIAKKMLAKKQPLAMIIEFTGLTKKEVEGLSKGTAKKK
jgi:DNA repair protein RadC